MMHRLAKVKSTILFQDTGIAHLAYTFKVTQMDNNHQPQLFFYIGWLNATCFGLTRNPHQENKAQNKLKLMKTARHPDLLWILGFYSKLITDRYHTVTEPG